MSQKTSKMYVKFPQIKRFLWVHFVQIEFYAHKYFPFMSIRKFTIQYVIHSTSQSYNLFNRHREKTYSLQKLAEYQNVYVTNTTYVCNERTHYTKTNEFVNMGNYWRIER